jgi:heterodisulfide reductase subunit B
VLKRREKRERENHSSCSRSVPLTLQRFVYVQFSNLPPGFEHENWPERGLAAGTLRLIGRVPKRYSTFAARNGFPSAVYRSQATRNTVMVTLTYYPGCSLKTSSRFYEESFKAIFSFFGIEFKELEDWSCCGASAAHTIDELLGYALAARNHALAELDGLHLFAPCSACYNRSMITNTRIREDKELREEINNALYPLQCTGSAEVKNIIEVLHDHAGIEVVAQRTAYDLSSIRVVPYYGCVLTRIMKMEAFDDKEDPTSMDSLIWSAGAELVSWPYKMECCGASKTLTDKDMTLKLSTRIMEMALSLGADAIVTPCPLCQLNLDLLPYLGREGKSVPVLFLTELLELAFFGALKGTGSHIIPVDEVVNKVKKK